MVPGDADPQTFAMHRDQARGIGRQAPGEKDPRASYPEALPQPRIDETGRVESSSDEPEGKEGKVGADTLER